jgi:hypothetical protein
MATAFGRVCHALSNANQAGLEHDWSSAKLDYAALGDAARGVTDPGLAAAAREVSTNAAALPSDATLARVWGDSNDVFITSQCQDQYGENF